MLILLGCLPYSAYLLYRTAQFLHIFQLEEYDAARFWHWLRRNRPRVLYHKEMWTQAGLVALGISAFMLFDRAPTWVSPLLLVLWMSSYGYLVCQLIASQREVKKKLVFTARAIRLLCTTATIQLLAVGMVSWVWLPPLWSNPSIGVVASQARTVLFVASMCCLSQLTATSVILANYLLWPLEAVVRWRYLRSARMRMRHSRAMVIGITGSFGKTSTKEILAHLLSRRYHVRKTPKSYNTLMGISKVVRTGLRPDDEVFVVEMGAYKKGEIRAICDLVSPRMGIITAIGPQHLERFGTLQNVMSAKGELVQALGEDGVVFYNTDYVLCRQVAGMARCEAVAYSAEGDEQADVVATHVDTGSGGTEFSIRTRSWGDVELNTQLLGRHNVANILGAIAVAEKLGVPVAEVKGAVETLRSVPHRLQVLDGQAGVVVIDDAYSANPVGAGIALDVLGQFDSGARILVTPGMVELGQLEYQENWKLGLKAAEVCDSVILVGPKSTSPIQDGLRAGGFCKERVWVCSSLSEARSVLAEILEPGDTVLFENDLPDQYLETS